MFAEDVVSNPVDPLIVVIPLTEGELNVIPELFNINPAPDKDPPDNVPEYNDPPLMI